MKTSLKELLFALVAFTLSYSVAHITEIKIVKDAVLLAFLIQWVLFVPAYIFQTEKFYDLSGSLTYISVVSFCFYNNYESNNINLGNLIIANLILLKLRSMILILSLSNLLRIPLLLFKKNTTSYPIEHQ